jgi:hypothetical protein
MPFRLIRFGMAQPLISQFPTVVDSRGREWWCGGPAKWVYWPDSVNSEVVSAIVLVWLK